MPRDPSIDILGHRSRIMKNLIASLCLAGIVLPMTASAADGVRVCLNWAPGADHVPLYAARQQGAFADADLAVDLRPGGGSGDAVAKLAAGECEVAVADFSAVIAARARGEKIVATLAFMADSPLAFYSIDGASLASPGDVRGRRIAADPKELARRLWPRFAKLQGVAADAVTWIDRPNNAKVDALAKGEADVVTNTFYHHHAEFEHAFGDRLRVLWWREFGVNPYGNVLVARDADLDAAWLSRLVPIVQRAAAGCVSDGAPCLAALLGANPHLDADQEAGKWRAMQPLLGPRRLRGTVLGALEPARLADGLADPVAMDAATLSAAATNRFLDTSIVVP
jgi:NitT/TauT family transport system substrate-binding protein